MNSYKIYDIFLNPLSGNPITQDAYPNCDGMEVSMDILKDLHNGIQDFYRYCRLDVSNIISSKGTQLQQFWFKANYVKYRWDDTNLIFRIGILNHTIDGETEIYPDVYVNFNLETRADTDNTIPTIHFTQVRWNFAYNKS